MHNTGQYRHNLIMLCDCWQTVNSDKACPSYVCNQYRRFAPDNHVRSEASNVQWMKLIRRVRRYSVELTMPVRWPLSLQ